MAIIKNIAFMKSLELKNMEAIQGGGGNNHGGCSLGIWASVSVAVALSLGCGGLGLGIGVGVGVGITSSCRPC